MIFHHGKTTLVVHSNKSLLDSKKTCNICHDNCSWMCWPVEDVCELVDQYRLSLNKNLPIETTEYWTLHKITL